MKYPSSIITINLLQNFHIIIQTANYNFLSLSCWLRGNSSPPLLNEKMKVANSCVKKMDLKTVVQKYLDQGYYSYLIIYGITGI